jgi:hypothetical protein
MSAGPPPPQPASPAPWQWVPSRQQPLPPRPGGTAPSGDIPELLRHISQIRGQGATIAEAEQAWVEGMRLINLRAAQFPGNGPVVNDFLGTAQGGWRTYRGQPPRPGDQAFMIAFNERTGVVITGQGQGLRPHPTLPGQTQLHLRKPVVIYP